MRFYLLIICIAILSSSCKTEKPPIPASKMADILSDFHMAESYAQLVPIDRGGYSTKNTDTLMKLYSHIHTIHDIDTASFNQALNWYKQRPKEFDKVYEKVLEVLDFRKEIIRDSLIEYSDSTEVFIKDSLKD